MAECPKGRIYQWQNVPLLIPAKITVTFQMYIFPYMGILRRFFFLVPPTDSTQYWAILCQDIVMFKSGTCDVTHLARYKPKFSEFSGRKRVQPAKTNDPPAGTLSRTHVWRLFEFKMWLFENKFQIHRPITSTHGMHFCIFQSFQHVRTKYALFSKIVVWRKCVFADKKGDFSSLGCNHLYRVFFL